MTFIVTYYLQVTTVTKTLCLEAAAYQLGNTSSGTITEVKQH